MRLSSQGTQGPSLLSTFHLPLNHHSVLGLLVLSSAVATAYASVSSTGAEGGPFVPPAASSSSIVFLAFFVDQQE